MRHGILPVLAECGLILLAGADANAQGPRTTRVSVADSGAQANYASGSPSVTADGRYIAFESIATNLVAGDSNGTSDVFVRDRYTATTTRVSVGTGGNQGNGPSDSPAESADGRYVAFASRATNLVAGDDNGAPDVFFRDRRTATTVRVSIATGGGQADGPSGAPTVSGDGRYVAFESGATNLVPGDTNGSSDVFVHDRSTNTTTRVSVATGGGEGDGPSRAPAVSTDGRYVAFESTATNLVPSDTNGWSDVFVHDRWTGTTTRVSISNGGGQGNNRSVDPALSANGRYVAFTSRASNLVVGDVWHLAAQDVYVHDRHARTTTRVSRPTGVGAAGDSNSPALSGSGRHVVFASLASDLVPGDTNGHCDVFVHDRLAGVTTRVSGGSGVIQAGGDSGAPAVSANGRLVAFASAASDLVADDTNGTRDVFVRDRGGLPVPRDFEGDLRSDATVFRPSNGTWYELRSSTSTGYGVSWGIAGDTPTPGDYDGDGKTDIAVYRSATRLWYLLPSTTGTGMSMSWGLAGDLPVPADYDGDGRTDVAVFRPSTGAWFIIRSSTNTAVAVSWGKVGDVPVPGDFDGDGKADPTVFRPSTGTWYQLRSTTGTGYSVTWGQASDVPLAGDYDGDGKADPTVFRASTGTWHELRSDAGVGVAVRWGAVNDVPIVGDYDGDGTMDPTVFRPSTSTWYQLRSVTGTGWGIVWGLAGDVPQ